MRIKYLILLSMLFALNVITADAKDSSSDSGVNLTVREVPPGMALHGSGFAVTDDGTYATAQHVVSGCSDVYVEYFNHWVKADSVKKHKNSDVALVHISEKTYPVRISLEDGQAQVVKMMGFPGAEDSKFSEKVATYLITVDFRVKGLFEAKTVSDIWQVDTKNHVPGEYRGMSGGPVIDRDGYADGVIVAESADRPYIVTMLPNDIVDLLDNEQLINNQRSPNISKTEKEMLDNSSVTQIVCKN